MATLTTAHRLAVRARGIDPRSAALLADAHALGYTRITRFEVEDLYFLEGPLQPATLKALASLLCDAVAQESRWDEPADGCVVEVQLRPGVTDPVAEQLLRAAHVLSLSDVRSAATGLRYRLEPALEPAELHELSRLLLANPVIHRYTLGTLTPTFPHPADSSGKVESIPVRERDDQALLALSQERRAALDLAEMRAIRDYYREQKREPTDVEFEMIAQTWSEHCVHKTFKARIQAKDMVIDGLLKTYLRAATEQIAAPWVRSAFVDNAGVIAFDEEHDVSIKVETHNHPSAIEPFGGANTGVGGVIRDVMGVSARPIAATDVLCFGMPDQAPPPGALHPRRIRSGVVAGIQDYGNKIGIPTVAGAVVYHPGYASNPLVYCGCVGLAPRGSHPRQAQPGDLVIALGGRTGRDGLRGATFSSMTMDAETGAVAGASVQIGNPIIEKALIDVLEHARDERLYNAITDCGAGGFSSAVGEMAAELGAEVELGEVKLKYPGLAPWEIWLSEAQERMVLAVPARHLDRLQHFCALYGVELTRLGRFVDTGRLRVTFGGRPVLELDNRFLHEGIPQRTMSARIRPPQPYSPQKRTLIEWLKDPNVASKAAIVHRYDHEVLGQTVVRPLVGRGHGPSDAAVLKPLGTKGSTGIAIASGIHPWLGECDPYRMALAAVDEAVRNAVAVGADPERVALLDNFCWGDPRREETLGDLVEACRGCYEAATHYRAPFVSGKDSLNNEYVGPDGERHAIPPTLLITALAIHPDVTRAVTSDLKQAGNQLYLVGPEPGWEQPDPAQYRALHQAMMEGRIRSCHDLSEGGLAVALAEMCLGGGLGASLEEEPDFTEGLGRLVIEVKEPVGLGRRIGVVTEAPRLAMGSHSYSLDELRRAQD